MSDGEQDQQTEKSDTPFYCGEDTVFLYDSRSGMYQRYAKTQKPESDGPEKRDLSVDVKRDWVVFLTTTLLSAATFIVVLVYTIYAKRQAVASEGATKATGEAVTVASNTLQHSREREAAQDVTDKNNRDADQRASDRSATLSQRSLQAAIDNFHRDQRAWIATYVMPGELQVGKEISATVVASNTGHTPARNAFMYVNTVPVGRGKEADFANITRVDTPGVIFPNGVMKASSHPSFHVGISQETFDANKRGDVKLTVIGKVTYDDVFKHHHWVTFCYELDPGDLTTYNLCRYGNDIDDEQK